MNTLTETTHILQLQKWIAPLLLALLLAAPVTAAVPDNGVDESRIIAELDHSEQRLDDPSVGGAEIDEHIATLAAHRSWAQNCIETHQRQLLKQSAQLNSIGPTIPGEAPAVSRQRHALEAETSQLETRLASCRVILQRSDRLLSAGNILKTAERKQELLLKGPNALTLVLDNTRNPLIWLKATHAFIRDNSGLDELSRSDYVLLVLIIALALGAAQSLRKPLSALLTRLPAPENTAERFNHALLFILRRYAIVLFAATATAVFFWIKASDSDSLSFIDIVAYGIPLVVIATALTDLFLRPYHLGQALSPVPDALARQLRHRLKVLVVLVFIGYLLFSTLLAQTLPESAFLLARAVYGVFFIINLVWISWLIGRIWKPGRLTLFRLAIAALFLTVLGAELLGYRNLSAYIFRILMGTLVAAGSYMFAASVMRDQLDSLDHNKGGWRQRLRRLLGLQAEQHIPGLVWLRVLLSIVLWTLLAAALLIVWQVPEATTDSLLEYAREGFSVGSFDLNPIQIVMGIVVLIVLLAINGLVKRWLEQEWLNRTQLERGARESIATISGYVGVAIAIIIALGVTGMDFSKLALIAGALSVGIGFGLQNIVNNFVSGLILLFERPIKTGDWIIVGETEGYVKKISIRSTRIQTFDRADVIVPNSELIATSVTNWMFLDVTGRIRVPVSVAYGSDTARVKELLLQVATQHPEVIKDGGDAPAPVVMFMEFGDSSLNFELRCHIRNIDKRLGIISDMNFAVDQTFRDNGIEIPFPQRDLHLRDWADKPGPIG